MSAFRNLLRRFSGGNDKKSDRKRSDSKVDPELLVSSFKNILKQKNKKWVLFKNGTVVIAKDQPDNVDYLINEAKEFLRRSSQVQMETVDFNVTFASEANGWLVSYDTERIYTFLPATEVDSDQVEPSSIGKTLRQKDAEELNVIYVKE